MNRMQGKYLGILARELLGRGRVFLNGMLLALAAVFYVQAQFVEAQIANIVQSVTTENMTVEQKAVALLREANAIVSFGLRNAKSTATAPIQWLPLRGFDDAVLLPSRYCGDAAEILLRLLDGAGIDSRIAQMRCADREGCHILVEANIYGRWVVLDPLFGIVFRNTRDQLATFREVSANWEYFRKQTPADYDRAYKYEGVRYTNWDKIPVLMPLLRRVLVAVLGGDRTSVISLRTYFLATYRVYLFGCLAGLLLLNAVRFDHKVRQGRSSALRGRHWRRSMAHPGSQEGLPAA